MANEHKLPYTAEEIEKRLEKAGEAILHTEQELTDEQKAQARANLGIGAAADTWSYNGYQLPPLPDWDKAAYPYAAITYRKEDATYRLSVHSAIRYYESTPDQAGISYTYFGDKTPGTARLYTCQEGQTAWTLQENTYWSFCVDMNITVRDQALWANFDLLNEEEDIYVMATEPVAAATEAAGITLPYVPLMTQLDSAGADGVIMMLSKTDSDRLTAVARRGLPCVIGIIYNGLALSAVAMSMRSPSGQQAFMAGVDTQFRIMLMQQDDGWGVIVQEVTA